MKNAIQIDTTPGKEDLVVIRRMGVLEMVMTETIHHIAVIETVMIETIRALNDLKPITVIQDLERHLIKMIANISSIINMITDGSHFSDDDKSTSSNEKKF